MTKQQSALIAMSGGVDSSVAAYLMVHAGYTCAGAIMQMCDDALLKGYPDKISDNVSDANRIADGIGIPFYVFDATEDFRTYVVEPFIACYEQGGTPNPCVNCNRHLKFDKFLEKAISMGFDYIATGHYASIQRDSATGRYLLYRASDRTKDQSYFLSCLTQSQLAHTIFPLGDLTKEQARQIAQEQGFTNAQKKDSQDICFIPDGDYLQFMQRYMQKQYPAGNFLDLNGMVVGRHNGAVGYTIGQRKGLGLAMGQPVYVCSKDMEHNTITVGPDDALFSKTLRATGFNWIPFPTLEKPIRVSAKIRYRHTEQPATVYPEADGIVRIEFDQPQRAITTGQTVALYDGDLVIGGGTIADVI